MISIIQNNNVYEIRFTYNDIILGYVKQVPGRRWNPDDKFWSIPKDNLGFFLNLLRGTSFESQVQIESDENINWNSPVEQTHKIDIPDLDISDIPQYVQNGGHLFKHQQDCMKFMIGRKDKGNFNGFLLADQMGLGKSLEVINMALFKKQYEGCKHCLIICCVNSTKYNWQDDIEKHTNGRYIGYILGSRIKRDGSIRLNGSGKEKLQDLESGYMYGDPRYKKKLPYFLIINIEGLRVTDNKLPIRSKYILTNKLIDLIDEGQISMIAIDEVHRNASPSSVQGKQILSIKRHTGTKVEWIPMTGTPIVNRPIDVFLPMRLVEAHHVDSYYRWNQHYCIFGGYGGHNIMGYKNIPELKRILEPNMLRRLKKDVLDLPPKLHHVEYVENTAIQERLYQQVRNDILNNSDDIVKSLSPLAKLLKLRQVNGCPELIDESIDPDDKNYISVNAKIKRMLEIISELVESGQKVVVFSNWIQPLKTAYKALKREKYKVCVYTGTMSDEDRELNKKRFIENSNYKIILGTIGAMGTSHTLSVATNVIFLDEPWNQATLEQAEDRCYRLNTTHKVDIYSIITKNTVDEKVHDIIRRKRGTSDYIVDNELDIRNHPELLNMLLDCEGRK